ncbi:MAG: recombinase family protein [Bacteroidales bacterium]|nr:recombinase family protein [Bacteroidales bacterium]
MNYAYIRVSTETQTYEGQRFEIENWCRKREITIDKWVLETVSGTRQLDKRTLGRTLRRMNKGDVLICTELSRLGRNMMMVMSILNACSQKGLQLYSIKDHFELSDNLNSKIIAFAFALAAEIERNLISQRTREALAAKKQAGMHLGRPCGRSAKREQFDRMLPEIHRMQAQKMTDGAIAKRLGIHRNTLRRYMKDAHIKG